MIMAVRMTTPFEASPFVTVLVGAIVGAITYIVVALLLRSKEMSETIGLLRRKLSRA
jgi:hypothetical protein